MDEEGDIKVFNRVEKKFLITEGQKREILKAVRGNMEKDEYFRSRIFNIYFDTDNYDLIVQSIERPCFKEKLRARSYEGYDKVFMEIKTKLTGEGIDIERGTKIGYKRRVLITRGDYEEFLKGKKLVKLAKREVEKGTDLQIAKEIDYLVGYFGLKPKILVSYERESYRGEDGLRLTFDENLSYRTENLSFNQGKGDKMYFEGERKVILEVKANDRMPMWLVKSLSENKIYQQPFSKIGNIYLKERRKNV